MNQKKAISHEALQEAIKKYVRKGGMIEKLPEQKNVRQDLVGGKWGATEMGRRAGK